MIESDSCAAEGFVDHGKILINPILFVSIVKFYQYFWRTDLQILIQNEEISKMDKLKEHIYDENNGLYYTLVGDYYIPDLKLPEESRSIGRYGQMHREYLKQEHLARYSALILTGELWTYLADLNEQAE